MTMTAEAVAMPAPEVGVPDFAVFQRLFEPHPEAATQIAATIDAAERNHMQLHAGDAAAQAQIQKLADGARWRFLGKRGDPLPEMFVVIDRGGQVPYIDVDPQFNPDLTRGFGNQISRGIGSATEYWGSEVYRGTSDPLMQSMQASSMERILQAAIAPGSTERERPLDEYERAWHEGGLIEAGTRSWGVDPREKPYDNPSFQSRRHYTQGHFRLEEATTRGIDPEADQPPHIRARIAVGNAMLAAHNAEHPDDTPLTNPLRIVNSSQGMECEGTILSVDAAIALMEGGDPDPAVWDYCSTVMHRLFEDGVVGNYAQTLHDAKWDSFEGTWRGIHNALTESTLAFNAEMIRWLRDPDLSNAVTMSGIEYRSLIEAERKVRFQGDRSHTGGLVTRAQLERDLATSVGSIELDQRTRAELEAPRLVMQVPRAGNEVLGDVTQETVLRIHFDAQTATGSYTHHLPYIPGFLLNAETWDGSGVVYDFVRDTAPDPYRFCDLPLGSRERSHAADVFVKREATIMADYVLASPRLSVGELEHAIAERSNYYTPIDHEEAGQRYSYFATDGCLQLQCTTAADVLRDALGEGVVSERWQLRSIEGDHTLPTTRGASLKKAGHRQLMLTDGTERYILDATPPYFQTASAAGLSLFESAEDRAAAIDDLAGFLVIQVSTAAELAQAMQAIIPAKSAAERATDARDELIRQRELFESIIAREYQLEPRGSMSLMNRVWQHLADNHMHDGDPVGQVARIVYRLTPAPEEPALTTTQLTTLIDDIDRTLDYLGHFKKASVAVRQQYGIVCSHTLAELITSTLLHMRMSAHGLRASGEAPA